MPLRMDLKIQIRILRLDYVNLFFFFFSCAQFANSVLSLALGFRLVKIVKAAMEALSRTTSK